MKNSNRFNFILFLALSIGLIFQSCKKEEDTSLKPPTINLVEFGYENSGEAYIGDDLHIDAEIVAEAKIGRIQISLHPEGEHGKSTNALYEWELDTVYTNFYGLKNIDFHEHIEIPMDADTGHYHFHMMVVDLEGNTKEVERELHVELSE